MVLAGKGITDFAPFPEERIYRFPFLWALQGTFQSMIAFATVCLDTVPQEWTRLEKLLPQEQQPALLELAQPNY